MKSSSSSSCSYSCPMCKKSYTRKGSLEKHKVLCEFKSKSKLDLQVADEEASDKPTYDQLVKIVQELSIKYVKMEEKVNEMQQYIDRKRQKMDVVAWLNDHIKPTVGFLEWVNVIVTAEPSHFLYLLRPDTNIFEAIHEVFAYNFLKRDFVCPLKCFAQKNGIFYICEPAVNGSCSWRELVLADFVMLLKRVQKQLLRELTEWQKDNRQQVRDNDRVSDQFNKAVIKLMNITFVQDANMSRIKTGLFHYLKEDLDNLV